MSKSRICHVTLGHDARDDRIFYKEAVSLRKVYEKVTVLAPGSGGEQVVAGVKIMPVRAGRSMLSTVWRLWRAARAERARCYHLHEPQLLPLALLLRGCCRVRIVYDIHEHLPEMLADFSNRSRAVTAVWARFLTLAERWLILLSDAVLVTSELLLRRYGKGHRKVVAIYNYPRPALFSKSCEVPPRLMQKYKGDRIILYHGQLARVRDLATVIQATKRAADRVANLKLLLLGPVFGAGYRGELIRLIEREQVQPLVELLDPVPHPAVPVYLALAEVGLVVLPSLSVFRPSLPIKLFECMSSGLPVIGSRLPALQKVIRRAGCGLLVEPSDADSLAEAIVYLLTHPREAARMGRRGRQAVRDIYNWKRMEERLFAVYSKVIGRPC
jgi:glycosyltransferase involved in cell wall biosynthesis